MKKFLLTVASVATLLTANAQQVERYVIYDGTTSDLLTGGKAYGFDGFAAANGGEVNSDTAYAEWPDNKFWLVKGSVLSTNVGYVGGTGNANFQATGDPSLFGITLDNVENARFSFKYLSPITPANVDIDFQSSVGGKDSLIGTAKFPITPALDIVTVDTALSVFKTKGGEALSAASWATVNKITIKVSLLTSTGSITAAFDDIIITDGNPTSVSDAVIANFTNEEVSVYNAAGTFVTSGKVENLNLTNGFYILKSATKTQKIVVE